MVGLLAPEKAASHQTRLQQIVLSWDYFRVLTDFQLKERAPRSGDGGFEVAPSDEVGLRHVPTTFSSMEEYLSIFEPLLLEECRAQIIRGREESGAGCDSFMVVCTKCERANEFHFVIVAAQMEQIADLSENDLLLISKEKPGAGGVASTATHALASVEAREGKTAVRLRLLLSQDSLHPLHPWDSAQTARAARMQNTLQTLSGSPWWLLKVTLPALTFVHGVCLGCRVALRRVHRLSLSLSLSLRNKGWLAGGGWGWQLCNLSTITREYKGLYSAPSLPFAAVLLSGHLDAGASGEPPPRDWSVAMPLMDALTVHHNSSQLQAIQAGLDRTPLVLIQGPPGTGKTQTVLGLLSVLLHSQPLRPSSSSSSSSTSAGPSGEASWKRVAAQQQPPLEMPLASKKANWRAGSPWLAAPNVRDEIVADGDSDPNSFFGATHNVEVVEGKRKHAAHVLICAPSNSALDEIVLRLIHTGLRDETGAMYAPSVVRVGLNAHHSVASVSMDHLVAHRLQSMERSAAGAGARSSSAGVERERLRLAILDDAQIVCSTLAFSGSGVFARMSRGFDVVVIDEAAQAVEPSVLVPLASGCRQVFLVGDPLQLPATVLSSKAVKYGYDKSLFRRLQEGGYPVHMLRTQYRMHSQFPSSEFYNGELMDAPGVDSQTARAWHLERLFGPLFFFDIVRGKEEQPGTSGSYVNTEEAEFVVCLYRHLVALHPSLKGTTRVGVISPYKHQVKLLRTKFKEVLGPESAHHLDVNTIDGFQGREKDVAIFSCVRTNRKKGIGFVADCRRMNVGLTRARASMLVVGCAAALKRDKHWGNLILHAKRVKRYVQVNRPYHKLFSEESLKAMRDMHEEEEAAKTSPVDADGSAPVAPDVALDEMMREDGLSDDDDADAVLNREVENGVDEDEDVAIPEEEEEEEEIDLNEGNFDEDTWIVGDTLDGEGGDD
eukprot:jgi/Mesen1/8332/ME000046S07724